MHVQKVHFVKYVIKVITLATFFHKSSCLKPSSTKTCSVKNKKQLCIIMQNVYKFNMLRNILTNHSIAAESVVQKIFHCS